MKTSEKGRIGVAKAIADLTVKGYEVAVPLSEHSPFDLVVAKDSRFMGVQVKYCKLHPEGCVKVDLRSCWSNKSGTHTKNATKLLVDVVCVYCPDTDTCYYIDPQTFNQAVQLNVNGKPSNNGNTRWAADYTEF